MDLGISQRELAELLGADRKSVENWERNRTAPLRWMLPRIDEFLGREPSETPPSIAERLTLLRRRLGLSQAELARSLRVHRCTVVRWETGKRRPGKSLLRKISVFLADANFENPV
jgi:transcriptional regulator with XRE-family HTH domain